MEESIGEVGHPVGDELLIVVCCISMYTVIR